MHGFKVINVVVAEGQEDVNPVITIPLLKSVNRLPKLKIGAGEKILKCTPDKNSTCTNPCHPHVQP